LTDQRDDLSYLMAVLDQQIMVLEGELVAAMDRVARDEAAAELRNHYPTP
jgi:hypothetical protein